MLDDALDPDPSALTDVVGGALCHDLSERAERVRWRWADVPWGALDPARASPALRALVRGMAFSEQTTYAATLRLLDQLRDDVDFSQWMSVWLYEETRHPQALLRWLWLLGERFDADFILRGRTASPPPRSKMGALVINVLSELVAAGAYRGLSERSPEPLLKYLARALAADEARHAAGFHAYAQRHLAVAADPRRERLEALKVLRAWLRDAGQVTHPVRLAVEGAMSSEGGRDLLGDIEEAVTAEQLCRMIGKLLGLRLRGPGEIEECMRGVLATEGESRRDRAQ